MAASRSTTSTGLLLNFSISTSDMFGPPVIGISTRLHTHDGAAVSVAPIIFPTQTDACLRPGLESSAALLGRSPYLPLEISDTPTVLGFAAMPQCDPSDLPQAHLQERMRQVDSGGDLGQSNRLD